MKLITLGDSITRGTFTNFGEKAPMSVANPNYSERLKEKLHADELLCLGVNGVSVSSTSTVNSESALCRLCEEGKDADVFVIAGGTNDFGTSVELGTDADEGDISFCGALDILYTKVQKLNPKAKVFVVLPLRRRNEGVANEKGYTLDDYRAAIERKVKKYPFTLIDGRKLAFDPEKEEDRNQYILDGLHPNNEGHKLYAELLYEEISKNL